MNFVFLSPHFPPNYQAFCIRLHELGVNVLGLDSVDFAALTPELQCALTEYYRVGDLHDYDALVRACGYFTHRYGKIDRIDSHAEYWLETEARLRTDFNIPGIRTNTIQAIKRKSSMKAFFAKAGVAAIRGEVCHTFAEALALAERVGFPLVVKPDIGVGAAATYRMDDKAQLEAFFSTKPPGDVIVEEFISGDIYSFDGLCDRDGNLCFWTSHGYSRGIMETVHEDLHLYYYSLRAIPPDLEDAGRRVLAAFDVRERFFHFEFFRRHHDGRIVALEVNMRPPGGLTTDMFNYANNFDIYREWANIVVHNRFEAEWSRPYHVIYVSRKWRYSYKHTHEEILARYAPILVRHDSIAGVFAGALGNIGYIARSPELAELLAMAEFIHELEAS